MRTNAIIPMFTVIAITTKNLIARWVSIGFKPFVESCSMMKKIMAFPKCATVIIDVVKGEKQPFSLTAASASIATISHNSLVLKSVIVGKRMFTVLFDILFVPFSSSFNVTFSGIGLTVVSKPFLRALRPFSSVFKATLFALETVKVLVRSNVTAFFTSFHGVTSILKMILDYEINVKGKAQRPFRKEVQPSGWKRLAPRTGDDMVCSIRKLIAVA